MSSRWGVRWGETGDHDCQGCGVYSENEASQCTRDEAMFPEIVKCAKGVEILVGAQGSINVGEISCRVVSAGLSSESVESSGERTPRELCQSLQGHQDLKPSSRSETLGVILKRQIACHRCGQPGHIRSQCQGRQKRSCFTCGKFDHIERNCPQKRRVQTELGLAQQPGTRQIVSQPQSQGAPRQLTVKVSTSPGSFGSQGRKRLREPNQPSLNQTNLRPPTLFKDKVVPQLDRLCYVCRKPGHFARNCPLGLGVHGESNSVQQDKRTPNNHKSSSTAKLPTPIIL